MRSTDTTHAPTPRTTGSTAPGPWLPAGAVALAALVRLLEVFRLPFEQDELYTVIEATHLFDSPLQPGIEARPLFYLLQHLVLDVAPVSHLSMRILPLLFGLAGVAVTVHLAGRVYGRAAALVTAALVTFSAWHIHISGMSRYWSLVYLLSALAAWALLTALETDRPRHYRAALATLALGLATHPTFAFPFVGVVLALHLKRPDGGIPVRWPSRSAWLNLWIPFLVLLALAWAALSLTGREDAVRNFQGRGWIATLRLLPAIVEWLTPAILVTAGLGALLAAAGSRSEDGRRWGRMSVLGIASTLALLAAAATTTDVYADYAAAMLPLAFVSAGALVQLGVDRMTGHRRFATAAAVLVLLAAMAPSTVSHLLDGMRFDFRPAFEHVAASADSQALFLSTPIVLQRHYAPGLRGAELRTRPAALDSTLAAEGGFWAAAPVRRYGIVEDPGGQAARWLHRHCARVRSFERPRFDYRLYRVDLYRCGSLRRDVD